MKKFLNILSFLSTVFKVFAEGGKQAIPAYEEMKKANAKDQLSESPKEAVKI